MDSESNLRLLTITCRFVPYDQWFVTHLDSSWRIKQVKHWLLSKCNSLQAPDPPRYRPVSPITFAATIRSKGSFDEASAEESPFDNEDSQYDDDDSDELEFATVNQHQHQPYAVHRFSRDLDYTAKPASNVGHDSSRSEQHTTEPQAFTQYTLMTFSTGQILEDDFTLSWYKLRPYEFLELHRTGSIVFLPRQVMADYIKPYFEVRVRALRVMWRETRERSSDRKAGVKSAGKKEKNDAASGSRTRTKVEWRERWVIIHRGMLNLCKSHSDPTPTHRFELSTLCALRGAEHLEKKVESVGALSKHVVCAKFRTSPAPKVKTKKTSGSSPSSPVDPRGNDWQIVEGQETRKIRSDEEELSNTNDETELNFVYRVNPPTKENWEWIVLDMIDENAYSGILRILHRHFPPPISSSFVSSPSTEETSRSSPTSLKTPTSPSTLKAPSSPSTLGTFFQRHPTLASIGTCPYPEWRICAINKAQRCGMGDVGKAMEWFMWGEDNFNIWNESSVGLGRAAAMLDPASQDSLHRDDADSDSDDGGGGSEAEWEGWPRDLERQARIQKTRTAFPEANEAQPQPHFHVLQDRMFHLERMSYEPTGKIYTPSPVAPTALSSPSSNESMRFLMNSFSFGPSREPSSSSPPPAAPQPNTDYSMGYARPRASLSNEDQITPPMPMGRMTTTTTTVSVGTVATEKAKKGRARSSTITAGILRKGKEKEKENKGKGKEKEHEGPERKDSSLPQFSTLSRQAGLQHARSYSSLCTGSAAADNFGEDEPGSPIEPANGHGATKGNRRRLGGMGLVRGVSVRAEKLVKGIDSTLEHGDGR